MYFQLMLVQLFRCLLVRYNHDCCPKASAEAFWIPAFMLYRSHTSRLHVRARRAYTSDGRTIRHTRPAAHGAIAQAIRRGN